MIPGNHPNRLFEIKALAGLRPAEPSVIVVRIQLHTPRLAPAALGSVFEYGKKVSGNSRNNKIFEYGKKVSGNRKNDKIFEYGKKVSGNRKMTKFLGWGAWLLITQSNSIRLLSWHIDLPCQHNSGRVMLLGL